MTAGRSLQKRGWAIIGGLVVVAMFAWGTAFYGLGFYLLRLNKIRGWSLSAISNIVFVFYAVSVLVSFWISKQLARRGPRPVIALGAVCLGAALIALPRVGNLWQLTAVYLVLAVGWSSTNSNPISTTIMAWFPSGQRELSIALIGASVGGIVLIPMLGLADERFGFTTAVTALGIASFVCLGALALFVLDRPAVSDDPQKTEASVASDRMAWFILRGPDYWVLGLGLSLAIAVQGGFLVHQLSILSTAVSDARGAQIVGIATLAALVGRFGPIVIGDRVPPAIVGAGYLMVQSIALTAFAIVEYNALSLTVMSMLYGVGVGVLITMPSLLTRTTYPELPYTSAYPVVNLAFQVPLTLGAPLLAQLHDSFNGYPNAMWILAAADLAAAFLFLANHRRSGRSAT